jgi:betaine-homocysteine S-methyltransferase
LAEGPVIGDGGFVFALEKRGYVKAGPWTPEAAIEHPDAGTSIIFMHRHNRKKGSNNAFIHSSLLIMVNLLSVIGLHREFLRAGSDVMQAFTFYASDDKLVNRGNQAGKKFTGRDINLRASELAKQVAAEGDALTLGGICQCPTYLSGAGKKAVQAEFQKQIQVFVDADLDFLLCEVNIPEPRLMLKMYHIRSTIFLKSL